MLHLRWLKSTANHLSQEKGSRMLDFILKKMIHQSELYKKRPRSNQKQQHNHQAMCISFAYCNFFLFNNLPSHKGLACIPYCPYVDAFIKIILKKILSISLYSPPLLISFVIKFHFISISKF